MRGSKALGASFERPLETISSAEKRRWTNLFAVRAEMPSHVVRPTASPGIKASRWWSHKPKPRLQVMTPTHDAEADLARL